MIYNTHAKRKRKVTEFMLNPKALFKPQETDKMSVEAVVPRLRAMGVAVIDRRGETI